MLLLLQAAAQRLPAGLPPINVTVQQPAGGMPDWAKIAIGALLAILTSLVVEIVKPSIAKASRKRDIARQVDPELMNNMATVESSYRVLRSTDPSVNVEAQVGLAQRILQVLRSDRYDLYFGTEKGVVFDLDEDQLLQRFYDVVSQLNLGHDLQGLAHWTATELGLLLRAAIDAGQKYIQRHKLKYHPTPNPLETMSLVSRKMSLKTELVSHTR
jgi:hypothetical protein